MTTHSFVVQIPLLSALPEEDNELKCIAQLLHNKPFTSLDEILAMKTEFGSWKNAHASFCAQLASQGAESTDMHRLLGMRRMAEGTPESMKAEYAAFKAANPAHDVVTIDWPTLASLVDRDLMDKAGMSGGMKSCCWQCGKRNCDLLKCGKCRNAHYCSRECQVAAWWHHKNTTSKLFACVSNPMT